MDKNNIDKIIERLNLKFRNIEGERLILAITCDENKNVLMTAFMNEEALKKTLETGYMHYYSTSRKKLWKKGEESGNTQKLIRFYRDCDGDALLFIVEQKGVACHEGYYSCFHYKIEDEELKVTEEHYKR
ncbi:phosphoribosyl-AMP cyclohydrolase [Methanocaldococcus fervens]|uniref:Phosphoribosyl-AMP cyclohydrolase n=1 Tax=Methanocaldococcus fervens (strain DSM 4213 / JCM 15782 / AG86) TaxID=573064 RepID=C7P9G7_METFA|nr:phosphoribosyl-AMP cyclohydrolase [Methanocaldococcus fervens]ACV25199.1 Phosphoribosyl-AMP cyclohydrolase [Methanocaldococcus fervens AG86]